MMCLGTPVQIRLNKVTRDQYEKVAASQNKPLATILREQLQDNMQIQVGITRLFIRLDLLTEQVKDLNDERGEGERSRSIETLLLLRMLTGPERVGVIQGELKRLGLDPYDLEEDQ